MNFCILKKNSIPLFFEILDLKKRFCYIGKNLNFKKINKKNYEKKDLKKIEIKFGIIFFKLFRKKKESGRNWFLSLSLRGRLPTLPLSQYHRRGEA